MPSTVVPLETPADYATKEDPPSTSHNGWVHDSELVAPKPPDSGPADGANNNNNNSKTKTDKQETVSFWTLLRFQDRLDRFLWVVGVASAVANGAVMPAFSYVLGQLLDGFNPGSPGSNFMDRVRLFSWIITVVGGISFILSYTEIAPLMISGERQMKRLRTAYVAAIITRDIAWFDQQNIDELVTRVNEYVRRTAMLFLHTIVTCVSSDMAAVGKGIGDKFGLGVRFLSTFLCGFGMGFAYSWQLTLALLGMAPMMAAAGALLMKLITTFEAQSQAAYAAAGGIAEERLHGIRTVQAYAGEPAAIAEYDEQLDKAKHLGIRKGVLAGVSMGIMCAIMFFAYALAFWVGSLLIARDRENTMAELVAAGCQGGNDFDVICRDPAAWEPVTNTVCWGLCPRIYDCLAGVGCHTGGRVVQVFFSVIIGAMAIGQAVPTGTVLTSARVAGKQVFDLLDDHDRQKKAQTAGNIGTSDAVPIRVEHSIRFQDVQFAYPTRPDQPVLKSFSLDIKPGQFVALVGRSGCGKSTCIALLEKFYSCAQGLVQVDGVDISTVDSARLRSMIGLVSQEPVLFTGTIRENIAMGAEHAPSDTEIRAAAQAANAAAFIEAFPEKYDTLVGQDGKALSGGQKQRVAIARALIRKPNIMLLDEATSALDSISEIRVQRALDKLMQDHDHITIAIAHRLSTIKHANVIVVVDAGRVVEMGTHEQLMQINQGVYRGLAEAQASGMDGSTYGAGAIRDHCLIDYRHTGLTAAAGLSESKADQLRMNTHDAEIEEVVDQVASAGTRGQDAAVTTSTPAEEYEWKDIWRLIKLGAETRWALAGGFLFSGIQGAVMPVFALVFADILDLFFNPTTDVMLERARFWTGIFVAIGVGCGIASLGQFSCFAVIGETVTRKLRHSSFKAMLHQDMAYHDKPENNTGALTTKLATDATLVNCRRHWPRYVVCKDGLQSVTATLQAGHIVSEAMHGIRTVHAFSLQQRIVTMYAERLEVPMRAGIRGAHVTGLGFGFSQFVMISAYGLIFYVGGLWVEAGTLSFKLMMRVLMTAIMAATSIGQTNSMATDMSRARQAARSMFELIDSLPAVDAEATTGMRLSSPSGEVEFRNVSFTYPTRVGRVLQEFSLDLAPGSMLAVVGASGSGKSTLVQLLQRFYQPDSGAIIFADMDVCDLNANWLRKQMGCVFQEPILFKGTIRSNIAYGKHPADGPATPEEVEAAARQANAHDFIMHDLPHGYDTDVSSTTLSGGQKQRIAIARALIRNPRLLLLDEATSALDSQSEHVVQAAIDNLLSNGSHHRRRCTTIVIAHRLSTVRNADKIIVMEAGRIVQEGTHAHLSTVPGRYKSMWDQQSLVDDGQRIV